MLYDAYAAEHIVIVRNAAVNNLDHTHYLIAITIFRRPVKNIT